MIKETFRRIKLLGKALTGGLMSSLLATTFCLVGTIVDTIRALLGKDSTNALDVFGLVNEEKETEV